MRCSDKFKPVVDIHGVYFAAQFPENRKPPPPSIGGGRRKEGGGVWVEVTIINMASHQVNTGNENESLIGLVFYSRTEPSLTSSNYAALFLI